MQGHWLLARLGKRVLRPGGIGLTRRLLEAAGPTSTDRVIELGPGVGRTAEILLAARPASHKGVDPSPEGREQVAAHTRAWVAELEPLIAEHAEDWHMLQPVFDADLDQDRLARSHAREQQVAHEEDA